jgi:methylphosphotriester-DNA--protein-cysteine methyltransferase
MAPGPTGDGFASDTQFHRVFRELTGMTPVGYRDARSAAALSG